LSQQVVKPFYRLIQGDCLKVLPTLEAESIDLLVTSPPYNLQKEYEQSLSEKEYLQFINTVLEESYRILRTSGRVCWNVPNQIRIHRDGDLWSPLVKTANLMEQVGFKFFDILLWNQNFSDSATAWGSWKSPSSPFIRHQCESILVFYKKTWKMKGVGSDLTTLDFMRLTKSELWTMRPETDRTHPAPFPLELPKRCIKLFSYLDSVILDPFLGSGTTMKACQDLKRSCIGIEIEPKYCDIVRKRCFGRTFLDHEVEYEFQVFDERVAVSGGYYTVNHSHVDVTGVERKNE